MLAKPTGNGTCGLNQRRRAAQARRRQPHLIPPDILRLRSSRCVGDFAGSRKTTPWPKADEECANDPGLRRAGGCLAPVWLRRLGGALALGWAASAGALELGGANEEQQFLPVDEAFALSTEIGDDGALLAYWDMPEGYYLYRHRFDFRPREGDVVTLGEPEIPPGQHKIDEFFGAVEVYYDRVEVRVPVIHAEGMFEIGISYQGCAEAGLCYPPETRWVIFNAAGSAADAAPPEDPAPSPENMDEEGSVNSDADADAPSTPAAPAEVTSAFAGAPPPPATEERQLASLLGDRNWWVAVALFFLGGIGLAFTPCVLPMVPILSAIIISSRGSPSRSPSEGPSPARSSPQRSPAEAHLHEGGSPSRSPTEGSENDGLTRRRAFGLSLAYVLGMAVTYAVIGTLMGLFGASLNLQAALQAPPVLIGFAAIFALLSLSMFGFYELRLPRRWQEGLDALGRRLGGGRHLSVAVMGALSALVVSPCVSAPLAGALIYISTTNDAVLGGAALLALGLGMGVPLLVIGTSGGHLLPKAGAWMNAVRALFGVLLLAVAIWLLERVLPPPLSLVLWAALLIGCAAFLGGLDMAPKQGWGRLWKALGFAGAVYGVLLLVGAAGGAGDPLRPLRNFGAAEGPGAEAGLQWRAVRNLNEVRAQILAANGAGRMALLDFYADWCISCKIMERSVFPVPKVAERLSQFHLLRADVTANSAEDKALLNAFNLFGPPGLVFFGRNGEELTGLRVQGEVGADALAQHLDAALRGQGN